MDKFNKYFWLTALFLGSIVGLLIVLIILFFLLKFFSISISAIPGTGVLYQFFIVITPYLVFFAGYYYLHKKIPFSTKKYLRTVAMALLLAGSSICLASLIVALLDAFAKKNEWLRLFHEYAHYSFIIQIVLLFATALIIAAGDAKEKDWIYRERPNEQ